MSNALNAANYLESRWNDYLSNSQRKDWRKCPARAYEWYVNGNELARQPMIRPFAQGSLLDAMLLDQDDLPRVEDEYRDMLFLKSGKPNAVYQEVQRRAEHVRSIPFVMDVINRCDIQAIYTGLIAGVPYRAKLDCIDHDNRFIWDLKHMASLTETHWSPELRRRVDFIEAFGYTEQLATYQELVLQQTGIRYGVGIIGVSKQDPPDVRLIHFADHQQWILDDALRIVSEDAERIQRMRAGDPSELERCEMCDYCRATRTAFVWEYEPAL